MIVCWLVTELISRKRTDGVDGRDLVRRFHLVASMMILFGHESSTNRFQLRRRISKGAEQDKRDRVINN